MKAENIVVKGARENNLKNVTVEIPKNRITVFTGVSGSGKSSLVFDTIAAESQRQLNELFPAFVKHRLPHYGQPEADALENLTPAVIIDQKRLGGNARSTVGTATDIYTLLRLLFSRIGSSFIGESSVFSFNHLAGMCPTCEGLGKVVAIDEALLFDRSKSLNEGAIRFPTFQPGSYRLSRYTCSGLFDNNKKLEDYTDEEWDLLLYAEEYPVENPAPCWPPSAKYFEGVIPRFKRNYLSKDTKDLKGRHRTAFEQVLSPGTCPDCRGARLNGTILGCTISGMSIADCSAMEIADLLAFVRKIKDPRAATIVKALVEALDHMINIGLHYLFLDRDTPTLSGGESQRIKMVKHLGSSLTGMTYILDEPSIGLHPRDVHQLNELLVLLRNKGNTVLVVEHDPDVIAVADHIIDIGPGAGAQGGEVVFQGTVNALKRAHTLTAAYWKKKRALKLQPRVPQSFIEVKKAKLHNLRNVTVCIPQKVLTVVTGVAGSGKSSLMHALAAKLYPAAVFIDQSAIAGSKRSNTATYTGIFDTIRELFAITNKVKNAWFSSNSEGACPACKGLGEITLDLAFMDPITTTCEACGGKRFNPTALGYRYGGKNIHQVLKLTITEAIRFFEKIPPVETVLRQLQETGLGYLTLGQPLSSLSGGERQRIKLALQLDAQGQLFIMDEPTTGLHMSDVDRLLKIFDRIVDNGSTLVVIEHNLDVISQADYLIDMGPGAGKDGGNVIFAGLPVDIVREKGSYTGQFLKAHIAH